jgi:preprotein translocase subunit SecA
MERLVSLATIDDLWCDHLAAVVELREATPWTNLGGRDPLHEYLVSVHQLYQGLQARITEEIPKRLAQAEAGGIDPSDRGATWTYISHDQPLWQCRATLCARHDAQAKKRSFWGRRSWPGVQST